MLEHALVDRATTRREHGVRDVGGEPLLDAAPDDLVGWRQEVALGVDLEPAVDAVGPDPEDRVGDRRDERPRLQVARRRLVQPGVGGRRAHPLLVAGFRSRNPSRPWMPLCDSGVRCVAKRVCGGEAAAFRGVPPPEAGDPSGGDPLGGFPLANKISPVRS